MCFESIRINDIEKYIGKKNSIVVDLRTKREFEFGHICGAINIPYRELGKYKQLLKKYQVIYMYCERGNVSTVAARDLYREGFQVVNLYGGIRVYRGKLEK